MERDRCHSILESLAIQYKITEDPKIFDEMMEYAQALVMIQNTIKGIMNNKSDTYASKVANIIFGNEGKYNSVNPNDHPKNHPEKGALSIGKLQWHGARAKGLLSDIVKLNPNNATILLASTTILGDLNKNDKYWNLRKLDENEVKAIANLLSTREGKRAQDNLATRDVQGYIKVGQSLGITDLKTLAYFSDLYNQGPVQAEKIVEAAGGGKGLTLSAIHQAAISNIIMGDFISRRNTTYEKILNTEF